MQQHMVRNSILAVLLLAAAVSGVQGAILIVSPSGGDFTTIQPALDAASPGDTIEVRAGTYTGGVVVHTPVTLAGEDGAVTGTVAIEADNVMIRGLSCDGIIFNGSSGSRVEGCGITADDTGMFLSGCTDCTVSDTDITAEYAGIMIGSSDLLLLDDVRITGATTGIMIRDSEGFTFRQTSISGCDVGIVVEQCGNGTLEETVFTDGGAGVLGIGITDTCITGSMFSGITQYLQLYNALGCRVDTSTLSGPDYFTADIFSDTEYACGPWTATGENYALLALAYGVPDGYTLYGEAMNLTFIPEAQSAHDPVVVLSADMVVDGAGDDTYGFYRVDGARPVLLTGVPAENGTVSVEATITEAGHYALMSQEAAVAEGLPLTALFIALIAIGIVAAFIYVKTRRKEKFDLL
jgi:nitrous oxidase accessory protein NosD